MSAPDRVSERLVRHAIRLQSNAGRAVSATSTIRGDLGLDSMRVISLLFMIEQDFAIDLSRFTDRIVGATTLADVAVVVRDAIVERDQSA